jgi:hypothetical protein
MSALRVVHARGGGASPERNRTSAAWLRARLSELEVELRRIAAYEAKAMDQETIRRAIAAIYDGKDWRVAIGGAR